MSDPSSPTASPEVDLAYHLHLVSDSTGETLTTVARAAAAQYPDRVPVEHVHPKVRTGSGLDGVIAEIEAAPGIVLFTMVDESLAVRLEQACLRCGAVAVPVLRPVLSAFRAVLGGEAPVRPGAQHLQGPDYVRRMEALAFTMLHDDGQLVGDLDEADVVLVGVSRTSKTPTSVYLAHRGVKTANVPLVPGIDPPAELELARRPLKVGLVASVERIVQIRQHRVLGAGIGSEPGAYAERTTVAAELADARRLFASAGWPVVDVGRRSVEETASEVIALLRRHRLAATQA